ncbi:hypothetical protein D3C87_1692570 [compost metagenome]
MKAKAPRHGQWSIRKHRINLASAECALDQHIASQARVQEGGIRCASGLRIRADG